MHVSANSTLGLSSTAFQEHHSATPHNKVPQTSRCPGYSLSQRVSSQIKLSNVVFLILGDLPTAGEGSSRHVWKSIFPLSLYVLRPK